MDFINAIENALGIELEKQMMYHKPMPMLMI
jgi:hypothetical protein